MSLKINNLATEKQRALLMKLEYQGMGKYSAEKLTKQEAAEIIDSLFEESRLGEQTTEEDTRRFVDQQEEEYPF